MEAGPGRKRALQASCSLAQGVALTVGCASWHGFSTGISVIPEALAWSLLPRRFPERGTNAIGRQRRQRSVCGKRSPGQGSTSKHDGFPLACCGSHCCRCGQWHPGKTCCLLFFSLVYLFQSMQIFCSYDRSVLLSGDLYGTHFRPREYGFADPRHPLAAGRKT